MNEAVKKIELRDLTSRDLFAMSRIIKKIGIANFKKCLDNDEIKTAIAAYLKTEETENAEGAEKTAETEKAKKLEGLTLAGVDITFDIANVIFDRLPECENEVYEFLASLSGLKVVAIQKLPMGDFFDMIIDVIKKPEFKDFFKRASRLFS